MTMCVHCNATEGHYHPRYGWPLCGTCFEEVKREAAEDIASVLEDKAHNLREEEA